MAFVRQLSLFFSPRKLCFLLLLLLLIFAITLVLRSVRRRSAATIIDNFDDAAIDMRRFIKKNVFDEADDKMEMNEGDKPEGNGDYLHGDNKRQWSNELKPIDDDDSREKNNGRAVLESDVGKIGREKLKFSFEVDERKPKDDELTQESGGKHQWSEDSNSEENFKELSKDENPLKDSEPEEKSSQDRHESDDREPQQDDKIIMYNKAYVRHPQRPLFISNDDGAADPGSVDTKNSADGEAVRPAEIADVDDKLKVKHFGNLIASKKRYDKVLKSEELYRRNLDDVEVVRRENEDVGISFFGDNNSPLLWSCEKWNGSNKITERSETDQKSIIKNRKVAQSRNEKASKKLVFGFILDTFLHFDINSLHGRDVAEMNSKKIRKLKEKDTGNRKKWQKFQFFIYVYFFKSYSSNKN